MRDTKYMLKLIKGIFFVYLTYSFYKTVRYIFMITKCTQKNEVCTNGKNANGYIK